MSALEGFAVYRTGANVGLRCPCGWRRSLGRSMLLSEITLAALQHADTDHLYAQLDDIDRPLNELLADEVSG